MNIGKASQPKWLHAHLELHSLEMRDVTMPQLASYIPQFKKSFAELPFFNFERN